MQLRGGGGVCVGKFLLQLIPTPQILSKFVKKVKKSFPVPEIHPFAHDQGVLSDDDRRRCNTGGLDQNGIGKKGQEPSPLRHCVWAFKGDCLQMCAEGVRWGCSAACRGCNAVQRYVEGMCLPLPAALRQQHNSSYRQLEKRLGGTFYRVQTGWGAGGGRQEQQFFFKTF